MKRTKRTLRWSRKTWKRRKTFTSRIPRSVLRPTYSFKRMIPVASVTASAVSPFVWNENYKLSNVLNYTEFTNLYDQYRINKVVTKIYLRRDPSAQVGSASDYPRLYFYRDYNDTAPPSNTNEVRENQKSRCVIMRPDRPVTLIAVPNIAQMIYAPVPATSNATSPKFKAWVESDRSDAQHFGFKASIDFFTNTNYIVDFERTYYISCKSPR